MFPGLAVTASPVLLDRAAALGAFEQLFDATETSMFKAEVLQDYTGCDDGPSLRAWMAGDHDDARRLVIDEMRPWIERCAANPATKARVHVVERPFTTYLEWEIACCYREMILPAATEQVSLVEATDVRSTLPPGDFWIFDETTVFEWRYEATALVGAIVSSSSGDVDRALQLRDELTAAAVRLEP